MTTDARQMYICGSSPSDSREQPTLRASAAAGVNWFAPIIAHTHTDVGPYVRAGSRRD